MANGPMAPLFGVEAEDVVELPNPAKSVPEAVGAAVLAAVAAIVLVEDVIFTRVGFWAPQGLFCLQAAAQLESPLQALTHWLLNSVHSKYGMV